VPDRIDPPERAHLRDPAGFSPPIARYTPSPDLADLVRRHWIPVWSLPDGHVSEQRVLQYPTCQVVITPAYAALVGPHPGLGTERLEGAGWAVGTALQPAAGRPLAGRSVHEIAGERVPLTDAGLVAAVRAEMDPDPLDPARQRRAIALVEIGLRALLPIDEEGLLVNAVVAYVEADPSVQRVGQVCDTFELSERTLQRLTRSRIGLSPKWLVQRRRLHEAAELLRAGEAPDLARIAAELGYSDQAHFSRDFRTVTGLTPGGFAGEPTGR
jgi:AraC-like DNA-binding protein